MSVVILGSGQLAKMLAEAGNEIGISSTFVVKHGVSADPVGGLGEVHRHDSDDQAQACLDSLPNVTAVTVETENTASSLLSLLSESFPVRPNTACVVACQNREHERQLLDQLNIPTAPHAVAREHSALTSVVEQIGFPLVLKTLSEGYDGKGQWVVESAKEWESLDQSTLTLPLLVEKKIDFIREISLIGVRSPEGEIRFYPPAENIHIGGILIASFAPAANLSNTILQQAETNLTKLMEHLDYQGVMAMECFQTADGLLVNELAPRVHNSGHWTMDSDVTSQFENHMRAITGKPLGITQTQKHTLMLNILGEIPAGLSAAPEPFSLYDYRKSARPGRKVGHLNLQYSDSKSLVSALHTLAKVWPNEFVQTLITQIKD
ncbi:N5-carboxyaminoimidazole ribonucleotide synthase [Arenicella chitinivorans]|uniref:N5-carboxyaminoimidazole ribonucleotide synthase n=1 Tax=Arenicella chitinivorans TaxID=1329800 RepID=A0A918RFZ3_9GAMM|nr:5-(carboxyamino)imidazole ribonucleotide synthase [Arenicella chitinivorans]GGZ96442.1 N5-carboxyaminoimidazole ribonucleotide synthase [Arenicella chitinivorans]